MQNKANLLDAQMNVTSFHTVDYENKSNWTLGENKPNQTQFQTQRLRGYEWFAKKYHGEFASLNFPQPKRSRLHCVTNIVRTLLNYLACFSSRFAILNFPHRASSIRHRASSIRQRSNLFLNLWISVTPVRSVRIRIRICFHRKVSCGGFRI